MTHKQKINLKETTHTASTKMDLTINKQQIMLKLSQVWTD